MKKICVICRMLTLITILFSAALFIGGDRGYAQQERFIFEVVIENNASNVTTVMQVYAENEKQARENVAANGWRVLSIKQLTYRQANPKPITEPDIQGVSPAPAPAAVADNKSTQPQLSDDEIIDSLLGKRPEANDVYTAHVAVPEVPVTEVETRYSDHEGLQAMPDADNLLHRATVYFDLGVIEPTLRPEDIAILSGLDKTKSYYLFGHTDNVSVIPNEQFRDNQELSERRAEAIKAILTENGINSANITTMGFGARYPDVKNLSSPYGTPQNRRVEIYEVRKTD